MAKVTIIVELDDYEAIALAQFVKRVTVSTCECHAGRDDRNEPYAIMDGLNAVGRGLGEAGYSPR